MLAGLNRASRIGGHQSRDSDRTVLDAVSRQWLVQMMVQRLLIMPLLPQPDLDPRTLRTPDLVSAFCIHGLIATLWAGDLCSAVSVWFKEGQREHMYFSKAGL